MLRKYFVCVEMTELCSKELISDPRDLALLERLNGKRGQFFGGEREAFFSAAGELVDVFLSLNCGEHKQHRREHRATPDAAVQRFFRGAAKAYQETHGDLPDDWDALRRGRAPEVDAIYGERVPEYAGKHDALRAWVRADFHMYTGLVGHEVVPFTEQELRSLLPAELKPSRESSWPQPLFRRVARTCFPKGAGVFVQLEDQSVGGELTCTVTSRDGDLVRGSIAGDIALTPTTIAERGLRETYRPFSGTRAELVGDFEYDTSRARFVTLRVVSTSGHCLSHDSFGKQRYQLAIELLHGSLR